MFKKNGFWGRKTGKVGRYLVANETHWKFVSFQKWRYSCSRFPVFMTVSVGWNGREVLVRVKCKSICFGQSVDSLDSVRPPYQENNV